LALITAIIWGSSFVAQSVGMDHIGTFTFNFLRNVLGVLFLIPVIIFKDKFTQKNTLTDKEIKFDKTLIAGGLACGLALFLASSFQQKGLCYTSSGKAGFITALYMVLVPVFGIFLKKKIPSIMWIGVGMATLGMYLLCVEEGFTVNKGDFLVFISSIFFAVHILVIDYYSPKVDGIKMSCIQFFIVAVLSLLFMLMFEKADLESIKSCWTSIAYAGILSSGIAFTLQILAQKDSDPTVVSIIFSLESVFAAISGWLILKEQFTVKELSGCIFVFIAVIMSQMYGTEK